MTVKLYDADSYLSQCSARVIRCEKDGENYKIYLDQTVFYARGGGQPADRGNIENAAVLDVYEDKTGLVHVTNIPFKEGESVRCVLDMEHRKDSMEQHLGQHIFSRVAEIMFGADTVAARIEDGVSHVEFDKRLTVSQMAQLENRVNEVINLDLPVRIDFYSREDAEKLSLPAKAFTHDVIRVVTIEGLDVNPCGGTHPKSTKEVQKCVITGTKEVRGVFRIYYKFGKRALEDLEEKLSVMTELQHFCSCFDKSQYMDYLKGLENDKNHLLDEVHRLKEELLLADCQNLLAKAKERDGYILITECTEEKTHIKAAIDKLILENKCAIGTVNRIGDTISLILAQSKGLNKYNMGAMIREYLSKFPGKGGGGNAIAQCGVPYSEEALKGAENLIKSL